MSSSAKLYEERKNKRNSQIEINEDKISEADETAEDEFDFEETKINEMSRVENVEEAEPTKEVEMVGKVKKEELAYTKENVHLTQNQIKVQLRDNKTPEEHGRRKSSVAELKV